MNVVSFIANRIAFNKGNSFSRFIIRLAIIATALGVAAMILTLAFVNGFQQTVSQKILSFWGDIRVVEFEHNTDILSESTAKNTLLELKKNQHIASLQAFATQSAVVENNKEIEGIMLKGWDKAYDFAHINQFLKKGRWINPQTTNEIVVSIAIANKLQLSLGQILSVYFIDDVHKKTQLQKLKIVGFYKTGIEEYDNLFAITHLSLIQKMNNWTPNQVEGYEIFLHDYNKASIVMDTLAYSLPEGWLAKTTQEIYPQIFDWLKIQDINRNVIFIIMAIVAIINLVTCLLILVLERTRMTGVLKALGCSDVLLQRIFLYHATTIALRGVLFGLLIGVGLVILQHYTHFIQLDETAYYVSYAPVSITWWQVLLICISTIVVCYISLLLPTSIIKKIHPVKAIKFN